MAQIIGLEDHTLGWSPALPLLNCVALDKPCSHPSFTDKAGSGDVNTGLSRLGKDQLSALTLGCVCVWGGEVCGHGAGEVSFLSDTHLSSS